jgi:hypothetical protein
MTMKRNESNAHIGANAVLSGRAIGIHVNG